jgi:hypothetical protein
MKHLFCFGLGYVSSFIINELDQSEWKISGSHTGNREIKSNEYIFNDQTYFDDAILEDVTHILISIPPSEDGDPVFLKYLDKIKRLPRLQWIGYFSSTSVYGDHQGNWVTEESQTDPSNVLGKNRLIAEKQWLNSKLPVHIFRLSAIYGPGRSVIDTIKSGKAMRIFKENHYFSRIHVQDIAQIIKKSFNNKYIGDIFNLADDHPSPQHEMVEYGCSLLGIEPPELINFDQTNLTENLKRYYLSSKKVSNHKVKNLYKIDFIFPDYKKGLINCF